MLPRTYERERYEWERERTLSRRERCRVHLIKKRTLWVWRRRRRTAKTPQAPSPLRNAENVDPLSLQTTLLMTSSPCSARCHPPRSVTHFPLPLPRGLLVHRAWSSPHRETLRHSILPRSFRIRTGIYILLKRYIF